MKDLFKEYDFVPSPFNFLDGILVNKENKILIKYLENADSLNKDLALILKKFISNFNCTFYLISEKTKYSKLDKYIIKRYNLNILNKESLEDILINKKIIPFNYKGKKYIQINGKKLKKLIKKYGYSVSKVSDYLNCTIESIYLYEKEKINMDYNKFLKLYDLFQSEEVYEIYQKEDKIEIPPEDKPISKIEKKFKLKGYKVYRLTYENLFKKENKKKILIKKENEKLKEFSKILDFEYLIYDQI